MTTFRRGWYGCGTLALAFAAWLATTGEAPAQVLQPPVKKNTPKNTAKSAAKKDAKKDTSSTSKPPASTVKPPAPLPAGNIGKVPQLSGFGRISYSPPGSFTIITLYGRDPFNPNSMPQSRFQLNNYPGLATNPYQALYAQPNLYYPGVYQTPFQSSNPFMPPQAMIPQYPQTPFYNTTYNMYPPNPFVNATPAFQYNSQFGPFSPFDPNLTNPMLNYGQPGFPTFDGFGLNSSFGNLGFRGFGN